MAEVDLMRQSWGSSCRADPMLGRAEIAAIAMAAGMVPSAMALGVGGEFRAPMAVAVISGLIVSTLLSLVFMPAVFLLMNSLSHTSGPKLSRCDLTGILDRAK